MQNLKCLFAIVLLFALKPCVAQEYHKFRLGIGFGYADGNAVRYFEPSLSITKKFSLGLRFEWHNLPHIEECISYSLNAQYYFTTIGQTNKPRFFAGFGLGIFSAASRDTAIRRTSSGILFTFKDGIDGARGGFYPRFGFDFNRFTFTFEYNFIYRQHVHTKYFLQTATTLQTWASPYTNVTDNYASFKLGYFLGGGKIKHPQIIFYDQNFGKLRLGFGLGYADLHANNGYSTSDAVVLYIEPSYRIKNNIAIGFRHEVLVNSSYTIRSDGFNGQYYFTNRNFRPFVGAGISLFYSSFSTYNYPLFFNQYYSSNEQTVLGFYPRIGFDAGHFSVTLDWNLIAPAKATINNLQVLNGTNLSHTGYLNNNYLSIKAGVFFGGGRKKTVVMQK